MSNHVTIGLYTNGEYKINVVAEEDLQSHIEYNKKMRPGRLFFVDEEYKFGGMISDENKCKLIEQFKERIQGMNIDTSKVTIPYV